MTSIGRSDTADDETHASIDAAHARAGDRRAALRHLIAYGRAARRR
jgi:hypothetical protein